MDASIPSLVPGIANARAITSGEDFSCAVLKSREVACWGEGSEGELGDGAATDSKTPVMVKRMKHATAIAADKDHACAVAAGRVKCWGTNFFGQLGDGTRKDSPIPVAVVGLRRARAIATGVNSSCAVVAGGEVQCWGLFRRWTFETGTSDLALTPKPVRGVSVQL